MGKIYTRKILFVIAAMLLCVLVAILIRLFFSNRTIRMTLTPIEVETGEAVHYADSTRNARSWLWEFGNGDISHERSGEYVFKEPGRYQVRLQVDGGLERKQIITVHKSRDDYGSDELVRMKAPATAFQGEIVSFKGYYIICWCWWMRHMERICILGKIFRYVPWMPGRIWRLSPCTSRGEA